jgi:serine/threonine protein kinase
MTTPVSGKLAGWTVNNPPPRETTDYAGSLFAGRYELHRQIGGGGMSTIHEAHDATLGTRVAIKIMRGDLPIDPVDRFRREAHVLAALSHEHIARIIDRQDPEEGPRFLVTEYIDGLDLGVLRRRGPLPAAVVIQIGLQVSAALAYVHTAGVIHRDIKPSNLMLVRHPGGDIFVKVIDFGLAQLGRGSELAAPGNAPPGARRATRGDAVHGTVPYWCGEEGPRRDIYALALTLAELLTGEAPDVNANLAREAVPPPSRGPSRPPCPPTAAPRWTTSTARSGRSRTRSPSAYPRPMRRAYVARALTDPSAPEPGEAPRFAERYIVCSELGEGGMGRVQLVFDTEHQRRVALKTIQPRYAGNKNLEARFRREGRALAAIEHIGVPTLLEGGLTPRPYFTMEIVTGVSLAAALKDGRMEPARALGLAIELGKILCAAHEVGVIHRDVKPDNIILGHGDRVHLLDFGACLLMPRFHQRNVMFPGTPPDERYNTGDYELVGTPGYTAPEVMSQESGAGPRSDVYSVCVVLYEMLTGWPKLHGLRFPPGPNPQNFTVSIDLGSKGK